MSVSARIMEALLLARPMLEGAATRRIVPKVVKVIAAAFLSSFLAATVLIGGLYVLNATLIDQGWNAMNALYLTFGVAVALLMTSALWLRNSLCELKRSKLPSTNTISAVIDGFIDGVCGKPEPK